MAIAAFLPLIGKVFDRILPDKAAANEAKIKLFELTQAGDLAELEADVKLATGQMEINKQEAGHASVFVAGWRPMVGWICAAGIAWSFVIQPFLTWCSFMFGFKFEGAPELDITQLMVLLSGMLGLGTMRSAEKFKGVARGSVLNQVK